MTIASGVAKQVRYKKESSWGVAPGATGGQLLRRVQSTLDLRKDTFESNEKRSDFQVADFRHGVRRIEGGINGELSAGTWQDFFAAFCRQAFQSAATIGPLLDVTASATAPQFVTAAGNFLTANFKVGKVVRWTGFAGGSATNNNSRNFLVTALTATQMSGVFLDGSAVVADASGDSVTCTEIGKTTFVPQTGHTDDSFYFEHWYSDISQSEQFSGCKVNQMNLSLPPTGMATIDLQFLGKDLDTGTSAYFTSPTAETATGVMAAVNGALYVDGAAVALLTGLTINGSGNMSGTPVAGSNTYPDIFEGRVKVSGQMTVYFQDATFRDLFVNETEASLVAVLTADNTATADFLSLILPRIKVGGAAKDDPEGGIVQTLPFTALLNKNGGTSTSSEKTTIAIQDSQAA